jgi:hypothetical protein
VVTEPGRSSQGQARRGPAAVDPGVVSDSESARDSVGPPASLRLRLAARRGPRAGRPPAVTGRAQAGGSRPAVIVSGAAAAARTRFKCTLLLRINQARLGAYFKLTPVAPSPAGFF